MPPTKNPTSRPRPRRRCKRQCQPTLTHDQANHPTAPSPSHVKHHQMDTPTKRITVTQPLLSHVTDLGGRMFSIHKAVRCNAHHFRPMPLFQLKVDCGQLVAPISTHISKDKLEERRHHSQYQMCPLSLPTTPTTQQLSIAVTVTRPTTHRHELQLSLRQSNETV